MTGLAAKYAVLSEEDFARLNGSEARGRLGLGAVRAAVAAGLGEGRGGAGARRSTRWRERRRPCSRFALPMTGDRIGDPLAIWRRGFELTYDSELRAERQGRPGSDRRRRSGALPPFRRGGDAGRGRRRCRRKAWRRFRRRGKGLSLVRLAKATTTYAGGVDYLAWKINRHAGTQDRGEAVAAALADIGRAYSAASSAEARRDPLSVARRRARRRPPARAR